MLTRIFIIQKNFTIILKNNISLSKIYLDILFNVYKNKYYVYTCMANPEYKHY